MWIQVAAALVAVLGLGAVHAQDDFPSRNITIVVPYPPGGVVDPVARLLAPVLSKEFGRPVVVDNRAGASGAIGARAVGAARPDGHTTLFHIGVVAAHPTTMKDAGYDVRTDLTPVSLIASGPYVISVHAGFPAKALPDLVAHAKANPGKVFYGSAGIGTLNHLAGELLNAAAGINMVHVPYKGNGPMIAGLLGGEIQVGMDTIPGSKALAAGGKLRLLAVTSTRRNAALPDIATAAESGVSGYEFDFWEAFFLPKGASTQVVNTWHGAIVKALRDPAVAKQLADFGFDVVGSTPQQLAEKVRTDVGKYAEVVRRAKITFE